MKVIFVIAMIMATIQANAEALVLKCKNVAASPMTATLVLDAVHSHVQFGSSSSGSALENDMKEKSFDLSYSAVDSQHGYSIYTGDILVDAKFKEFRALRVSTNFKEINDNQLRVLFQISEPYIAALGPDVMVHYGMLCSP